MRRMEDRMALMLLLAMAISSPAVVHSRVQSTPHPGPQPRIIGGSRITNRCIAPYNAMVALQFNSSNPAVRITYCSGVMVSEDTIVTAAICVFPFINFDNVEAMAVLGEKHLDFPDQYQVSYPISSFKIHPDFQAATSDNNVAIIKLRERAVVSECVRPLDLYQTQAALLCGQGLLNCTITGWGQFDLYGDLRQNSKYPLYGHIRLADETVSAILAGSDAYPGTVLKENTLLGFAYPGSTVQACLLDWGGMVACQADDNQWKLRAIIGEHNCLPRGSSGPMVVPDLDKYRSWINACVQNYDSLDCSAFV